MLATSSRDRALEAARRTFLRGARVEMQALADELGVSRVTLHRWVGNRDLLLGEVMWSLAEPALAAARAATRATGAAGIAEVAGRYLQGAHEAPWLRAFLEREGEIALRILTTDRSVMQRRTVEATRALLEPEVAAGRITPTMDLDDLAYTIVRIGESFLYTDVIAGGRPAPDKARRAILALLS
jgi:AcrR family transcriptional regulator